MLTNYHTHTTRCQHARGTDEEYVLAAIDAGFEELGFADHSPWRYASDYVPDMRMTIDQFPDYLHSIRALRDVGGEVKAGDLAVCREREQPVL